MQRSRIRFIYTLLLAFLVGNSLVLKAQTTDALGTYTPYSLFGIGEIEKQGTALNRGMGGIGVGLRDNRFINYLNPASITERDTLSFMFDLGVEQTNIYNSYKDSKSAYNTFNMRNIIITAPIYKKSALMFGITPYSNIGYKFESIETNPLLVSEYGDIRYQKYGEGSINQFFFGAAMNFLKNFSVGAQYIYYFGALNKYSNINFQSDDAMRNIETGWDYGMGASSFSIGLQHFGVLNKEKEIKYTVGATYKHTAKLKGDLTRYAYATDKDVSVRDTVMFDVNGNAKITIPNEFAVGFTVEKKDKWLFGFDYVRQDWSGNDFYETISGIDYKPEAAQSFRAGFEIIPNKYDIRYYFKRVTYRVGFYHEQSYVNIAGNQIKSTGVTIGMGLPIFRYNTVNFAVDLGQRGSTKGNLVRERYAKFIVNISLHDIWFVKHKYQ